MLAVTVFRFAVVYFGLFCLTSQITAMLLPVPGLELPNLDTLPPIRPMVLWFARHTLGIEGEISAAPTGSGDRTFDWVWMLLRALLAFAGALLLTLLRGSLPSPIFHSTPWARFCLLLRAAVGTQMLSYGFAKLFPLQMPYPSLSRLVEPFGNFSPMGVLWNSIGASPAYESFLGFVEALAGTLILIPATAAAGALLCSAVALQVFVLNMTYDVPVKLLSLHLLAMSTLAAAPAVPALIRALAAPRPSSRLATVGQCLFAFSWLGIQAHGAYMDWFAYGPPAPKSPLYGIWNMDDTRKWRRVIFDEFPERAVLQRPDDSFLYCKATFDTAAKSVILAPWREGECEAQLIYRRDGDKLTLQGTVAGEPAAFHLRLTDRSRFLLVRRGFHWIQEKPYNR